MAIESCTSLWHAYNSSHYRRKIWTQQETCRKAAANSCLSHIIVNTAYCYIFIRRCPVAWFSGFQSCRELPNIGIQPGRRRRSSVVRLKPRRICSGFSSSWRAWVSWNPVLSTSHVAVGSFMLHWFQTANSALALADCRWRQLTGDFLMIINSSFPDIMVRLYCSTVCPITLFPWLLPTAVNT